MNINYLKKLLKQPDNLDARTATAIAGVVNDWRPKWFFQRVTEPQFRNRNNQLIPRPKPSYPPDMSNYDRMGQRRMLRMERA